MSDERPPLHVVELSIQNIKRIRAVRIRPGDAALVPISGANGSGKTSVLDAILYALGGKGTMPPEPIRRGSDEAVVRLDLGEVVVTRSIKLGKDGEPRHELEVRAASGAKFSSPQRWLDEALGDTALLFDPLAFDRMKPKERLEELRRLVPLSPDVPRLEQEARAAFEERTVINRMVRDLEGKLAGMPLADWPRAVPDVTALLEEMQSTVQRNAGIERDLAVRKNAQDSIALARQDAATKREQAEALLRQAEALEQAAENDAQALAELPPVPPLEDVTEIRRRIEEARAMEGAQQAARIREQLEGELRTRREQADALTAQIETARAAVAAHVAAAQMPVPELTFGDGDVFYRGLPYEQASGAERLRVALGLAMAAKPRLRLVRIEDGPLLDERSLALVAEMAQEAGYQVWVERVDTSGVGAIVIEDGELAGGAEVAHA